MKQYSVEYNLISCILQKPSLINELFVELECFSNSYNKMIILFLKEIYDKTKTLDLTYMLTEWQDNKSKFVDYYTEIISLEPRVSLFYEYQTKLIEEYKNKLIKLKINQFTTEKINLDNLVEDINKINNDVMVIEKDNKIKPDEMLRMIRNKGKIIEFDRFKKLNEKLKIKKKTVNVIGARPSEGKSALALNLFCDLAKNYKCLYFNMEMTEEEVYERMIGIEGNLTLESITKPESDYLNKLAMETAQKIYNYKYEVINGSKTVNAMKSKIIKEQREEHLIIFIDYVGYIVGKPGQTDRDRIGEAVRELNNITKDYDCTIFLIAQINRNGSDVPTMQDLKDSGEIEQTADTIILIHDDNKNNNENIKEIGFLIPKCRGGKRNIRIPVEFNKAMQRMSVK